MQILWSRKNHVTSRAKKKSCNISGPQKNCATSQAKKILGGKNHATSRDKSKSRNLLEQKKIMQPLWFKIKSRNLLGPKKITKSLRTKKSKNLSEQKKSRNI